MKRLASHFSYLAVLLALTPSCNLDDGRDPDLQARVLENFGTCEELTSYAKSHALESLEDYYKEILESAKKDPCLNGSIGCDGENFPQTDVPAGDEDGAADPNNGSDPPGDSGSDDKGDVPEHSTTNNQVEGVDEPDIVKTDGKRIVALQRNRLYHIDASGPTPVLTGSLEIEGSWGGGEMFLSGNKVLLIDSASSGDMVPGTFDPAIERPGSYLPVVRIHEIDLSNPAAPQLLRRMHVVGSYNGARLVNSVARLVLQSAPLGLNIVDPWQLYWDDNVGNDGGTDVPPEKPDSTATGNTGGDPTSTGDTATGGTTPTDTTMPTDTTTGSNVPTTDTTPPGDTTATSASGLAFRDQISPPEPTAIERLEQAIAEARELNKAAIAATTDATWLPHYTLEDFSTGAVQTTQGKLYDCNMAMRPGAKSGLDTLNIITFDLQAPLQAPQGTGVFASGGTIYSNAENLYVATMPWSPLVRLASGWPIMIEGDVAVGSSDGVQVDPATGGGTTPSSGSAAASDAVALRAQSSVDLVKTHIHKFAFGQARQPVYAGSGSIDGYLLNQFAMSEHKGDLRVAATTMPTGWNWDPNWQSSSFVSVLRPDEDGLTQVGHVGDLGLTEQIQSVRFDGDVGYVVTFRQTDPLYTIDLRDPLAPKRVGELKVEGFSAYLHPLGNNLVLGVGRDATGEGQITGLQVSLFDVSNLAAPTRVANYTLADADTQVNWDHRAFLYWAPKQLAVIPVQSWGRWDEATMQVVDSFSGVLALQVAPTGITKLGEISHPAIEYPNGDGEVPPEGEVPPDGDVPQTDDDGDPDQMDPGQTDPGQTDPGQTDPGQIDPADKPENPSAYVPMLQRSLVIGETLYTLSEGGLKGNSLNGLAEVSWLSFE